MNRSTPGLPVHHQLPEFTQTHVHWVGDANQPSHPVSSPSLAALILPSIRVFSNKSVLCIRWPKYCSFGFNISPTNEHLGWSPLAWTSWISLQSKGPSRVFSNTTVQKHQFFSAQLCLQFNCHIIYDYWKKHSLTRWTFVDKVMSLLFNMLSRLVITFHARSKHLLISWLQSPSAVMLETRKIKSAAVSTVSPSKCHEVIGPDLSFLDVEL